MAQTRWHWQGLPALLHPPTMDGPVGQRNLGLIKWLGVLAPVAFVVAFEVLRITYLDRLSSPETAHFISATLMIGGVVVFGVLMATFVDRAQRQIVAQNRDLTLTHGVSTAARERLDLPEVLADVLEQITSRTEALAAGIRVGLDDGDELALRHPQDLGPGLTWVASLLDEPVSPASREPTWSERRAIDTGVMDVPLTRGRERLGHLRVVFHPAIRPGVSASALGDIAGEIATAIQLGRLIGALQQREHERAALYEVALGLTGRSDLDDTLDTITGHARELLGSDRAVVCLADSAGGQPHPDGRTDRLALADNGSTRTFVHVGGPGPHDRNPFCRMKTLDPGAAFASRPLRGPDGILGELCVARDDGRPFKPGDLTLLGALADMAAIAVRTARLHAAEQQWTILSERDRIARELHDSLAQVLGVIHLRLRALEPALPATGGERVGEELAELADIADEAYRDVREAILGLRETISAETGLEGALRDYFKKYTRQTGIRASLVCEGDARHAVQPRSEVQLLRVVQEALTNVRKHARASHVVVHLDCSGAAPVLVVEDDGVGFDPTHALTAMDGGFGLTSMRERVDQIGGTMDLHTTPGEGTRITIHLNAEEEQGVSTAPPARPAGR